jgi:hypothetical protein
MLLRSTFIMTASDQLEGSREHLFSGLPPEQTFDVPVNEHMP